ncbi:MAG: PfkB family carbohydrate kinase [Cyclobacteriaceae bacterium]|nr:PfkB family carbohydrate kinase [Cyclobacteriaceae bacterium]
MTFLGLNRKEALFYTGTETLEGAKKLSQYCKVSAITDGEKGLYFNAGNNTLHSLSKVEEVYSTIDSGDCLLAGIIAGYVMRKFNQQIADLGAACGAANCIRPELGLMHNADVERLLNEIG